MAPPPIYNDLGKMARDLFRRGYHPGLWQLDCKTMTSSGLEFFTTGFASQDASKVMGSLQSKYNMEDYGLTLTERWNTDNLLYGEIAQKDKLAEGLLLALEGRFQPSSGDKEGAFMARFSQDNYHLMGKISIKSEPVLALSAVMGHKEFLGGVACDYDIDGGKVSWKLALGWLHEATTLHGELIDAKGWLVSLFHKANDQIDVGFEIAKSGAAPPPAEDELVEGERPSYRRRSDLNVSLGMIYHLEGDALIRAKINNKVELGLGYEQKLREGVTISVSTVLEGKNISDGNHKFGVGLSLQC